MLTLEKVTCGYGNQMVVKDVSFTATNGQKICVVGPNGCGKSTLLKAIVGLLDYTGMIQSDEISLRTLKRKEVANQIGFMSQMSSVYFPYTVFETVMLGRYSRIKSSVFSAYSKEDREYVENCIEAVQISHLKDRAITQLSGGELQRVLLAKVFAQDPKIILLDEPTNHLDLKHQIQLMQYLEQWTYHTDKIVIAVLHDINLALSFADQILVLSEGEKIAFDTKDVILKNDYLNQVYDLNVKEYMKKAYGQWRLS